MSRSARSSSPEVNDPATLPESTRDYYRSTWGFDPVADCRILGSGRFQYEECFPLPQDLPLQTIGITICARVDWKGEDVRNRIVFRRSSAGDSYRNAGVECIHTIVYAGPASDALTFADNIDTIDASPDMPTPVAPERLNRTEKLVTLPPWEHFAALKSYVAAVADMGVIALLRPSIATPANPADGLPFGFNAEMHAQVVEAIYAIAPRAMLSIYRDLTCEFLDSHPPAAAVDQWYATSERFAPSRETPLEPDLETTVEYPDWGLLLRHLGEPTLVYWFRNTEIADKFQDHLFINPPLLAKAQAIAPDLLWDTLRLEWEARREAKGMDSVTKGGHYLNYFPAGEVWARTPFCDYTFPRNILSPDSMSSRRSRVQAYLSEMTQGYSETDLSDVLTDAYLDWAQEVSSHLDAVVMAPFPADHVRPPLDLYMYDQRFKSNEVLTPLAAVDHIKNGNHKLRRVLVLSYPLAPKLQVKLATHWDFATRLALIGNPGTITDVIAMLAQDPQPCVRLAAAARVRRGTASFDPLFGEILDPGEMVWLLSSHPGVVFQFGVTAWGDGSDAYREWFKTRLRENKERNEDWTTARLREIKARDDLIYLPGELYAWAYSEGIFLEEDEQGCHGSHLAYYGLTPYACGQMPCLYLGLFFLGDERLAL